MTPHSSTPHAAKLWTLPATMGTAMAADAWSHGLRVWAMQTQALLRLASAAPWPATASAASDAMSGAVRRTAETVEEAADTMTASREDAAVAQPTATDIVAAPVAKRKKRAAPKPDVPVPDLPVIEGTFTAVETVADTVETAPEAALEPQVENLVADATGYAPRSLEEMIPDNPKPAE